MKALTDDCCLRFQCLVYVVAIVAISLALSLFQLCAQCANELERQKIFSSPFFHLNMLPHSLSYSSIQAFSLVECFSVLTLLYTLDRREPFNLCGYNFIFIFFLYCFLLFSAFFFSFFFFNRFILESDVFVVVIQSFYCLLFVIRFRCLWNCYQNKIMNKI